jgi:PAS domain-containing protein
MQVSPPSIRPSLVTIPSSDVAFGTHVRRIIGTGEASAQDLERRLRRVFPRVIVRERSLSGEAPVWYVYRDGRWRSPATADWWREAGLPRVRVSPDGWLVETTPTAAGLLGISADDAGTHHFTDFIVPGTLDDSVALFQVVEAGNELNATVLLRPLSGEVIAIDLHAARDGADILGVLQLADDVDVPEPAALVVQPSIRTTPDTDVAFRGYVVAALRRMPEPTPEGLALRVRRLYPHAIVRVTGDAWLAQRDGEDEVSSASTWWHETGLPSVRYDAQALILEANEAARQFFGRDLEGHYWQEFVTPGSTEQVTVMLEILADVGAAESRFRMPRADGGLMEFDSYTIVEGEEFTTTFRPAGGGTALRPARGEPGSQPA